MFYGYWLASFTEILKTCSFLNSIYSSKAALYNIKHKNLPLVCVKKRSDANTNHVMMTQFT